MLVVENSVDTFHSWDASEPAWTETFSAQPEIERYLQKTARDFGVMDRIVYLAAGRAASGTTAEVVRYLESNRIAVYGTLVGDSATWGLGYLDKFKIPLLPLSPDNILPRYTDATGGHLYSEFSENGIQRSFAELASLARTQYTIAFYSHVPVLDEKFRSIEVRVLRPNLDVVTEKGYYPTATNLQR